MFRRFIERTQRFMYGRYGMDRLNQVLFITALAVNLLCPILSLIFRHSIIISLYIDPILRLLGFVLLALCLFRMLSRNIYARQKENRRFTQLWSQFTDRNNRYYRCPKCKQTVRVPRGRGKIKITCPKCKEQFIRKT